MKCSTPLLVLVMSGAPALCGGQTLGSSDGDCSDFFDDSGSPVTVDPTDALNGLTFEGPAAGDFGIFGSPPCLERTVVPCQTGVVDVPVFGLGLGTEFVSISDLQIAVVPEPAVTGLAGLGALALFRRRRVT